MQIDRALNRNCYCIAPMQHYDDTHRIPDQWLEANAKSFHFTSSEIMEASIPCSSIRDWPIEPKICGIYFLIERDRIMYVGLSINIPRRIVQHLDGGVPSERVAWFEAPEFYLKEIEAYYIQRLKPPRNTSLPRRNNFTRLAAMFDV